MSDGYETVGGAVVRRRGVPKWRHAADGQVRRGFIALLAASVGPGTVAKLSAEQIFLIVQGLVSAALAAVAMLTPMHVGSVLRMEPPLGDDELAILPLVGLTLFVISFMYVQGARSKAKPDFIIWACAYRVLVVPLGVLGLYLRGGARPELCLCLGVYEGILGALTCVTQALTPSVSSFCPVRADFRRVVRFACASGCLEQAPAPERWCRRLRDRRTKLSQDRNGDRP